MNKIEAKKTFHNFFEFLGGSACLIRDFIRELRPPIYYNLILEQIHLIGVKSFFLIFATALSTGMVMTLQFGISLQKFGGAPYIPKIISLSIIKEIGPVFTSLLFAARVGAGITSEIGSMVVTQQIDAIRALGTSPIKRVVIPRVIACLISVPLLAVMANLIGILGALFICSTELGLDTEFFIQKVFSTVSISDYLSGLTKTFFFALIISFTACHFGLNIKEGTKEVGQATTKSVVVSSIFILISDYFLTKFFWMIELWIS